MPEGVKAHITGVVFQITSKPGDAVAAVRVRRGAALNRTPPRDVSSMEEREVEALRAELQRRAPAAGPGRWNADPDDVQRSVVRLVLALVEFLRRMMERQAIRRMEAGTLTPAQVESIGLALMKLEDAVKDIAGQFGIAPEELNIDLGPLGRLL